MPKRAAPGGADGDAAATASAMDAHRLGRRWAALALADIAGWPLDKIRKKIRGTTATSLKRWREALRARDDVADAPRSGAEHRRVTEADLDLVRAAIEEPLAAGGRHRKRSLKRSIPIAIGRGATDATYETYRRRLHASDRPWRPQMPRAVEGLTAAQRVGRHNHCSRHGRSVAANTMFTDSSWFHGETIRLGSGSAEWGPAGNPGTRPKKQRASFSFHAYGGVTINGATPLIEAAGTTPAPVGRGRGGRGRGRGAARGARGVTAQSYREQVLVRADGDGLLQQGAGLLGRPWRFQQDGARPHTCAAHTAEGAATRAVIARHATLLEPWPARSPDLSPIEKAWARCKQHLWRSEHLQWHNITTFKAAVRQAWREVITPVYCRRLFGGIRRTYAVCAAAGGAPIVGWGAGARPA